MNFKKSVALALAVMISLSIFCNIGASALSEIWPHKTQFTYSKSNPAWLSDLSVSEKPGIVDMLVNKNILTAKPSKYEYAHTPESFKNEVAQYMRIYNLDESSYRAAYVYAMETLNKFSASMYADMSDAQIKEWLEAAGIIYPSGGLQNEETLIFARALYTVLKSNSAFAAKIPKGYKLEAAIVAYIGHAFNKDLGDLEPWDSTATLDTLQKYVIAVSKAGLHSNGYVVGADTSDEAIYKMMAVMVIEQAGYAIDVENASFEEVKLKYMSAMLAKAYDVSLTPSQLDSAIKNNSVSFYILQAMGQKKNITIKSNTLYTDAFSIIAQQTDFFRLEHGEFYSDISNYDVYFEYIRDYFWLWPKALMKNDETKNQSVQITVDNVPVKDDLANKIAIKKTATSQSYKIAVNYSLAGEAKKEVYTLTVYQGEKAPPASETSPKPNEDEKEPIAFPVFDALTDLFEGIGNQTSAGGEQVTMPSRIMQIVNMFSPSFGSNESKNSPFEFLTGILSFAPQSNSSSNTGSGTLGGIGGVGVTMPGGNSSTDLISSSPIPSFANSGSSSPLAFGSSISTIPQTEIKSSAGAAPYEHISELGAPPSGYTYVTDSKGYVLGLSMKYDDAAPDFIGQQAITVNTAFKETLDKYQWLFIPALISIVGISGILIWKRKKGSTA